MGDVVKKDALPIAALKALRPKQWAKNVLLFAALVFSTEFLNPDSVLRALWGFGAFSLVASIGYIIMAVGLIPFFINIVVSLAAGKKAAPNPWGEGATTLEWTLSSPPPYHQFETLPEIK